MQLANGATISILASHEGLVRSYMQAHPTTGGGVTTDGTVYGSCGSSYITMNYKSNLEPVHMDTGFEIYGTTAVEYSWSAVESGSYGTGYNYNYSASGGLAFRSTWHGQHSSGNDYPTGTYTGVVNSSGSWALTVGGSICYSGGPVDVAYLIY